MVVVGSADMMSKLYRMLYVTTYFRHLPPGLLANTCIGTPFYLSPEILHGESYDMKVLQETQY